MDSCRRASECERVSLSSGVTRVQEPGRGREEGKTGAQTGTHGSAGGACAHAVCAAWVGVRGTAASAGAGVMDRWPA